MVDIIRIGWKFVKNCSFLREKVENEQPAYQYERGEKFMYCFQCGERVESGQNFCHLCGTDLTENTDFQVEQASTVESADLFSG